MADLQKAISSSQRKSFLAIAFLLLLSIIGIPLLIYAVYTIYILLPYSKIMRLLQFHQMLFQKWKEERVFSPLPSCCCRSTEVVNWCAVRLPSPYPHVSVTLWLPVLGTNLIIIFIVINIIVIIMLPYMRATRILIVRDAYRSLTMASNHQRDYGYSLLLLLVGLGESLETVACLGRSPTVWTEVLTPMSTRKDDQRCWK